ncbi:MAG: hypothetical protein Q8Q44_13195, partial [Nocardioides sp.]|nr:hypothetical protein [Nocardioides sp.]
SHARVDHDLTTARGITEVLCDFVGDPSSLVVQEEARRHGPPPTHNAPAPDVTTPPPTEDHATAAIEHVAEPAPEPDAGTPAQPDVQPEVQPDSADGDSATDAAAGAPGPSVGAAPPTADGAAPSAGEQPTQAGLPIFDDEADDVTWLNPRPDAPPPPPPFEEPPERPLFAPDSAPGSRADRAAPPAASPSPSPGPAGAGAGTGVVTGAGDDYWPWDTGSGSGPLTGTTEQVGVPGRSWLRLAAVIAAAALLLVAVAFAYQLGSGNGGGATDTEDEPTAEPTTGEPVSIAGVADFDPQGNGEENPDRVGLAHDGDPSTAWPSLTYEQNFGPGGLKTGLGLVVELDEATAISGIDLTMVGEPTDVEVYITDEAPSSVDDLEPAATGTVGAEGTLDLADPVEGRFVTLWFTSIPGVEDGRFRAEVAEVEIRG